jgi:hypothetical protein
MTKLFEMGALDSLHSAKRELDKAIEVYEAVKKKGEASDMQTGMVNYHLIGAREDIESALAIIKI